MIIPTFVPPAQLVTPCCLVKQRKHLSNFSTALVLLLEILNPPLKLYCDPHSENYSFDVVKFAYLTMPRITQRCWPYSIIYALIIFSLTRFSAQDLVTG